MKSLIEPGKKYYLGIDVGSRNLKMIVIGTDKKPILKVSSSYGVQHLQSKSTRLERMLEGIRSQIPQGLSMIVSTGTGYSSAESCNIRNHITEVEANLAAARFLYPAAMTIFEIGGTDAKYIEMPTGMHRLNNRCSSSTGISLENLASELELNLEQLAEEALKSDSPLSFDAVCSVFARLDAIAQIQAGKEIRDVIMGYVNSMVDNFLHLAPIAKTPIIFQGGVALNKAVVKSFRQRLNLDSCDFIVTEDPLYMVAYGAALAALQSDHVDTGEPKMAMILSSMSNQKKQKLPLSLAKMRIRLFNDKAEVPHKYSNAVKTQLHAPEIMAGAKETSKKPIVWLGNLVPPEIFIALGYNPVWPARDATRYGNSKLANDLLRYASQQGFTQDCCSIQRLLIGLDSQGILEAPELIVGASSYCDYESDAFRAIADKRKIHEMRLEIPILDDYNSRVEYLQGQLKKMHNKAAEILGVKADEKSFADSVGWSVKIMERMAEINVLRTMSGSPRISSELLGFAFSLPYIRGSYEAYQIVEQLHKYIIGNIDNNSQQQEHINGNPRLLWDLLPDAKGSFSSYLDDSLVFESVNFVWPKNTPLHGITSIAACNEPYEQLARMILSNAAIKLDDRIEAMKRATKLYNLDGVITYQQPHCPLARGCIEMAFQRELKIPLLMLNSDIATGSLTPITRTRIDAFMNYIRTLRKKPVHNSFFHLTPNENSVKLM